jgi:hypothetical protein
MLDYAINNEMTERADSLPFLTSTPYIGDMVIMAKPIIRQSIHISQDANTLKEEWKPISGYEELYEISNHGNIKSLQKEWFAGPNHMTKMHKQTTILKFSGYANGYKLISLQKKGKKKNIAIHLLVYDHFGEGKRNGRIIQVDHIDENKRNNRIDNLQLLPARENVSKSIAIMQKTSKYVGVYFFNGRWGTQIWFNGSRIYLGSFTTEIEAYDEYQRALLEFKTTGNVTSKNAKKVFTSKHKGVTKRPRGWGAAIKKEWLGTFQTEHEAHLAYENAAHKRTDAEINQRGGTP